MTTTTLEPRIALHDGIAKLFARPVAERWDGLEEIALTRVVQRKDCLQELAYISAWMGKPGTTRKPTRTVQLLLNWKYYAGRAAPVAQEPKSDFTRGFVCAITCLIKSHGKSVEVADLLRCAGSHAHIAHHADDEDIQFLRECGYLPFPPCT